MRREREWIPVEYVKGWVHIIILIVYRYNPIASGIVQKPKTTPTKEQSSVCSQIALLQHKRPEGDRANSRHF